MIGEGAGDVSTFEDDEMLSGGHERVERGELRLVRGSTTLEEKLHEAELFEGGGAERSSWLKWHCRSVFQTEKNSETR